MMYHASRCSTPATFRLNIKQSSTIYLTSSHTSTMTAVLPPNAPGDLNTLDIHEWRLTVHNLPLERTGGLGTGNKSNQHISDDLRDLLESIVHCGEKKGKRIV